ncbi:MAG: MBL fold metallo-hydrolase [Moraxellaceae bacterium]|nr:MBL fold metallo-hydrolase [Pseudobdellovibrionaceae bacterium]
MKNNLIFQQLFESQSSTFTYLLGDAVSKEAILIDTVIQTVDRDLKLVAELGLKLVYVLDTHIHADHVTGAGEIRKRTGVKTAVPQAANVPCADLNLSDGDELNFGSFKIKTLETPGHTDASLSYLCEGMVFTGDVLLIRGTGRTDFQSGSAEVLYESVHKKLFTLPPETQVYPAHDYKGFTSSTVEMEIRHNPRVGSRKTKTEFVQIMKDLKLDLPQKISESLPANMTCGTSQSKDELVKFQTLNPQELTARFDQALIVDVRGPEEYFGELGHIKNSHQITLGDNLKQFLEGYNRSEEIVFVCRSGQRSQDAAKLGVSMGFQKVSHLGGGMLNWNECKLPVEHKGRA